MFTKTTNLSIKCTHSMHYLTAWLRTRAYEAFVLLITIAGGLLIVFYLQWIHKPALVRRLLGIWSSGYIYGAKYILGVKYQLEGLDNIPAGQVIYMGNHQTAWESVMMTVLVKNVNIVTKLKAISIPVFGWGLKHAPMIVVDPSAPGQNLRRLLKEAKATIKAGRSIVIFPEGSRVPIGETRPYARGFELLYKHCGVPVVPFVSDAGLHWPSGFSTKYPATITLRVFPPIKVGKNPEDFATELENIIRSEASKLMAQSRRK